MKTIFVNSSITTFSGKIKLSATLGTNVASPNPPGEKLAQFYHALTDNGFKEHIIQTDYKFTSHEEAARIMGGFFGDSMKNDIIQRKLKIIKEYTGIFIKNEEWY